MKDGGWTFDAKDGWKLDPSQVERVRLAWVAASLEIDKRQAGLPHCVLCGQRVRKLDFDRLCSKTDASHQARRRQGKR